MNNDGVKNIIQETLGKLGIEVESITEESLEGLSKTQIFTINTPDSQRLIGRDGVGFQALNHLISRIVYTQEPDTKRFTIDINGYYKQSLERIKQKARFAADRARSFKTNIELEPMSSFERLIVHSLFPEDGDIKTHSEGAGSNRRIVFSYTGD